MIRRRLPLPSSGTPFLSCFHLVTTFRKNISSKPFGIWAKKERERSAAQFFCVAVIPVICGRCAPKKKSGRNLSCGHGNSTGNRKSLTMRVQVGILRTLRLSCRKQYAQISITSQLYHKILWLSRKAAAYGHSEVSSSRRYSYSGSCSKYGCHRRRISARSNGSAVSMECSFSVSRSTSSAMSSSMSSHSPSAVSMRRALST